MSLYSAKNKSLKDKLREQDKKTKEDKLKTKVGKKEKK